VTGERSGKASEGAATGSDTGVAGELWRGLCSADGFPGELDKTIRKSTCMNVGSSERAFASTLTMADPSAVSESTNAARSATAASENTAYPSPLPRNTCTRSGTPDLDKNARNSASVAASETQM
jgi:hypothetical protein